MIDYYRFIVGKEFNYPAFNGYLIKPRVIIGKGSFYDNIETFKLSINSDYNLPQKFIFTNKRTTEILNEEMKHVKEDSEEFDPFLFEEFDGVSEYSVSGWAKWVDPGKTNPWNTLFRLSVVRNEEITNLNNPGDRTLLLLKGNGYYHFSTYSCTD